MGYKTFVNVVILIAIALVVLYAVISIILQAESNITFWMLRPSEKAAMDIVGRITALAGTTGNVETDYSTLQPGLEYYLINSEKITCVIARQSQIGKYPVMGGMMTTINCYSTPLSVDITNQQEEMLEVSIEKKYEDGVEISVR